MNQICLEKAHLNEIVEQKVNYREAKLSELRANHESLEKEHDLLNRKLKEIKTSLDSTKSDNAEKKNQIDRIQNENKLLQSRITKLEKDLRDSEANSARVNSLLNEYKSSAESLTKQLGETRKQLKESKKESDELSKSLGEEREARQMLEIKCQTYSQEVVTSDELRKTIKELQTELNQLKLDKNIR